MCSIFGSFDVAEAKHLKSINAGRGSLSGSSSVFDSNLNLHSVTRVVGDLIDFDEFVDGYHLYHQQAPTTQELNTIHPSEYNNTLLWHNGIIKQSSLNQIRVKNGDISLWDTHQINILLNKRSTSALSELNGSFSCVWYVNKKLYMFRNEIAPMFVLGATISSVKFTNSMPTLPNTVYSLNVDKKEWCIVDKFINNETPFFFFD